MHCILETVRHTYSTSFHFKQYRSLKPNDQNEHFSKFNKPKKSILQSWTALFRAFSSHRQPSASLTKLFPSWTRLLAELTTNFWKLRRRRFWKLKKTLGRTNKDVKLFGKSILLHSCTASEQSNHV